MPSSARVVQSGAATPTQLRFLLRIATREVPHTHALSLTQLVYYDSLRGLQQATFLSDTRSTSTTAHTIKLLRPRPNRESLISDDAALD